jgi:Sporulation inhibitor of replication protein SirA
MRHYQIYLIEEEIANHYFGRESIIYHLFLEHERTTSERKKILKKQIQYVTRPIPSLEVHQWLETHLKKRTDYQTYRSAHLIFHHRDRSHAKLKVFDRSLSLTSNGNYEAETIFFDMLYKYNPCFFAIDFELDRYGWLNPIKIRKFV